MGTLTAFSVVAIAVPVLRRQQAADPTAGFRVPFGPYLVPGLSVAACVFIMKDLSVMTIRVFLVWMIVAVAIYLLYGIRHSRLDAKTSH